MSNMLSATFWNISNYFDHHEGTVIGIATICLVLITAFLWRATRDLVSSAEKTAERQLRAYVNVDKCTVDVTSAGTLRQYVSLRNFGQTPAHNCSYDVWFRVWPDKNVKPEFTTFIRRPTTGVLAPSAIVELDLSFDIIRGREAANVLNGKADLYVWGTIFYSDVFGVERETNFRMKYSFRKNQQAGLFRATNEGNQAT